MAFRAVIWLAILAFVAWRLGQRMGALRALWASVLNPPPGPPRQPPPSAAAADADPWTTLGVPRGASAEVVRAAYQKAMQQYHPDQVAHLGADLQALAEQRTKAITAAYARLRPPRRR